MNKEKKQDALDAQQQQDEACRTTETPLELLLSAGVDPTWANEYLEFEAKLYHFFGSFGIFWNLSPRFIRMGIKRPETLMKLMKKNWESSPDRESDETWEQFAKSELESWNEPHTKTWYVNDLLETIGCYEKGMSPMETIIEAHSDCDDGHENDPVYVGDPDLTSLLMGMAIFVMFIFGAITYFNHASNAAKAVAGL